MTQSYVHIVKSAQRVLEVLEYFDGENTGASVTDISRALSYPQSSTSILLRCLKELGFLYYNRARRTYRPTARAALLCCWADNGNYRGGKALDLVDAIAERFGETVALTTNQADYAVHHLYIRRGTASEAVAVRKGRCGSVLHSIQGELILSGYPDPQIRLALHRLNSEEDDPGRRVNIDAKLAEMQVSRQRGWSMSRGPEADGTGSVAVLIPRRNGGSRIAFSLLAKFDVIKERGEEILKEILQERDMYFASLPEDNIVSSPTIRRSNVRERINISLDDHRSP